MKVGIIGHSRLALEQAVVFHQLGAEVGLFYSKPLLEQEHCLNELSPQRQFFNYEYSAEVQIALGLIETTHKHTYSQVWSSYLSPLNDFVQKNIKCRNADVLRVHKRFINKSEEIPKHSRLFDLFRIVYNFDPTNVLEEQLKSNPSMFEQLPEEVINSMSTESEAFEDFDIVIEVKEQNYCMGPAGTFAINEKVLSNDDKLIYGLVSKKYLSNINNCERLTIVGSNYEAALNILSLSDWLLEGDKQLTVVTEEKTPFSSIKNTELYVELFKFFDDIELVWNDKCESYKTALHEWRALDTHIKVKKVAPSQPLLPIQMYNSFCVSSFDKLIDREGLFLTIEKPTFRDESLEKEVLLTIGSDGVVICNHSHFESVSKGMRIMDIQECIHESEPGIYTLAETKEIEDIKNNVLSFFSRK